MREIDGIPRVCSLYWIVYFDREYIEQCFIGVESFCCAGNALLLMEVFIFYFKHSMARAGDWCTVTYWRDPC